MCVLVLARVCACVGTFVGGCVSAGACVLVCVYVWARVCVGACVRQVCV